jgi:D-amino peptidase
LIPLSIAVKDGIDKFTADCLHPKVAQEQIREATARALRDRDRFQPYRLSPPYTIGIEWNSTTIAATCDLIPGVRMTSPRFVEYTTEDYPEAMRVLVAMLLLGLQVGQKGIYG